MKISNSKVNKINDKLYFSKLCNDSPYLIINTECGIGKYKFNKIGYNNKAGIKCQVQKVNK